MFNYRYDSTDSVLRSKTLSYIVLAYERMFVEDKK